MAKHKNAPARSKMQILAHRKEIAELILKGWSQYAIAEHLKVSRDIIRFDLDALQKEWMADSQFHYAQAREMEKRKIDLIEYEAWEAWRRSKTEGKKKTRQQMRGNGGSSSGKKGRKPPKVITAMTERQESFGDPRYLDLVRWSIDRRIKLFDLDPAPAATIGELPAAAATGSGLAQVIILPAFAEPRAIPKVINAS